MSPRKYPFAVAILRLFLQKQIAYMKFNEIINEVDAVVFDLGAVILNIAPQNSVNQFDKIGIPNFFGFLFGTEEHVFFEDFERGKLSPHEFRQHVRHSTGIEVADDVFDEAFNAMLLNFPQARIEAVLRCAQRFPTYLLSNTNELHYKHYSHRINSCGIECLDDMFVKSFFSHRLGMRKPDSEIYEYIISQIGVPAHKILFLDDNLLNIEAAERSGIRTIRICGELEITNIF